MNPFCYSANGCRANRLGPGVKTVMTDIGRTLLLT